MADRGRAVAAVEAQAGELPEALQRPPPQRRPAAHRRDIGEAEEAVGIGRLVAQHAQEGCLRLVETAAREQHVADEDEVVLRHLDAVRQDRLADRDGRLRLGAEDRGEVVDDGVRPVGVEQEGLAIEAGGLLDATGAQRSAGDEVRQPALLALRQLRVERPVAQRAGDAVGGLGGVVVGVDAHRRHREVGGKARIDRQRPRLREAVQQAEHQAAAGGDEAGHRRPRDAGLGGVGERRDEVGDGGHHRLTARLVGEAVRQLRGDALRQVLRRRQFGGTAAQAAGLGGRRRRPAGAVDAAADDADHRFGRPARDGCTALARHRLRLPGGGRALARLDHRALQRLGLLGHRHRHVARERDHPVDRRQPSGLAGALAQERAETLVGEETGDALVERRRLGHGAAAATGEARHQCEARREFGRQVGVGDAAARGRRGAGDLHQGGGHESLRLLGLCGTAEGGRDLTQKHVDQLRQHPRVALARSLTPEAGPA